MSLRKTIAPILILLVLTAVIPVAWAQEADDTQTEVTNLRELIEQKNSELEQLQAQRAALEAKLQEVGQKSDSLTKELSSINYSINQLEISVRSNRLLIEKLELEIDSLGNDIHDIEKNIDQAKEAIGNLLVQLQQRDNDSLLVILLKSASLSDSVSEIQSIMTLGDSLNGNIAQLQNYRTDLTNTIAEVADKKEQKEIEQKTLVNRQYIIEDQKQEKQELLTQTKNEEKSYEEQVAQIDEKQDEISAIITEIEDRLRSTLDPTLVPKARRGLIDFPLQDVYVTQEYGETEFAKYAYRTRFHTGVDFSASIGTPIFAVDDGVVAASDNNDKSSWQKYQYGQYILIEHEYNLTSMYAHLSRRIVSEGETVTRGQLIGYSGNTGYSTGPHLHFGVYVTPILGWRETGNDSGRENGGLIKISPAAGLVPVGATLDPMDYLPYL